MTWRTRLLCLLVPLLTGLAAGAALAPPSAAQRDQPPRVDLDGLDRYGTRHLLPALTGTDGAADSWLEVSSTGWAPTDVLVVELAAAGDGCNAPGSEAEVLRVHCVTGLERFEHRRVDLTGGAAATAVLVYSVSPDAAEPCGGFAAVSDGQQSLAAWEDETWSHGEPLVVVGHAAGTSGPTALAAQPTLGVTGLTLPGGDALTVPAVAPGSGRLQVLNAGAECAPLAVEWAAAPDDGSCGALERQQHELPPHGTLEVDIPADTAGPQPLTVASRNELAAFAQQQTADGWLSYGSVGGGAVFGSQVIFPLAVLPLPELEVELWLTNQHPEATTDVSIVMFDGNQSTHKVYNDPAPLCPRATRRYDLLELAGEIPGSGRGGQGPPLLSLRVDSRNTELEDAPHITGLLVLRSAQGTTAYTGWTDPTVVRPLLLARRTDRAVSPHTVVPGVKKGYGEDGVTTLLAVQSLSNIRTEPFAVIDLYDDGGTLVAAEIPVRLGNGPAGLRDLGAPLPVTGEDEPVRLPDGFVGTAVVRSQRNLGPMAVVALDHPGPLVSDRGPSRPAAGAGVTAYHGVLVPAWPDPSLPTPTPRPTFPRPTATATGPAATDTPPPEPTPTGAPPAGILLPSLLNHHDIHPQPATR